MVNGKYSRRTPNSKIIAVIDNFKRRCRAGAFISGISLASAGRCITKDKETSVFPAQAGIHSELALSTDLWIPACAGKTVRLIDTSYECTRRQVKLALILKTVLHCALFINYKTSNKDVERKQTVRIEAARAPCR